LIFKASLKATTNNSKTQSAKSGVRITQQFNVHERGQIYAYFNARVYQKNTDVRPLPKIAVIYFSCSMTSVGVALAFDNIKARSS